MREALHRCSALLLGWLPDWRGVPVRKQAAVAVIVSALLHLLILLSAALLMTLERDDADFAKPQQPLRELVIEMPPPPPPAEEKRLFTLDQLQKPEYLDSTGLAKSEKAPEQPLFESDQNMIAASELPATGDVPLPSVDGRADLPFMGFNTQDALVGAKAEPFSDATPAAPPRASPPPVPKPVDTPPEKPESKEAPSRIPPGAADPDVAPVEKVDAPREDQIAIATIPGPKPNPRNMRLKPLMAEPKPVVSPLPEAPPAPLPPITPPARPEPSTELAKLVPPAPRAAPPKTAGYQAQKEKTRIAGSISNRGRAAVDAVRTPMGTYKKQISEAVGSRWNYYVKQRMDMITVGVVQMVFYITEQGRVENVQIVSNTANDSFAQLCEQAVREAEFAPAPPEVAEAMKDGRMEVPFSFTFYDPH